MNMRHIFCGSAGKGQCEAGLEDETVLGVVAVTERFLELVDLSRDNLNFNQPPVRRARNDLVVAVSDSAGGCCKLRAARQCSTGKGPPHQLWVTVARVEKRLSAPQVLGSARLSWNAKRANYCRTYPALSAAL